MTGRDVLHHSWSHWEGMLPHRTQPFGVVLRGPSPPSMATGRGSYLMGQGDGASPVERPPATLATGGGSYLLTPSATRHR